jgi:hypothetical protein
MKLRVITALALLAIMMQMTSCARHQFPGSYHQNNRGQARYY